jgi:hypothetical protein
VGVYRGRGRSVQGGEAGPVPVRRGGSVVIGATGAGSG